MAAAAPPSHSLATKVRRRGRRVVDRLARRLAPRDPVYVFHHLPKCGGTSLVTALGEQFRLHHDYRPGPSEPFPEKKDLRRFRSCDCLCGHFEIDGYHLHQRYPETLTDPRYRLITFVRDPLQVQLSLYRYETKRGWQEFPDLESRLKESRNFLSKRFPVTEANYRETIDRYFFVGVLEDPASVPALAQATGRPFQALPWTNRTRTPQTDGDDEPFSPERLARFQKENALDYLIYNYCVEKLNATRRNLGV